MKLQIECRDNISGYDSAHQANGSKVKPTAVFSGLSCSHVGFQNGSATLAPRNVLFYISNLFCQL